MDQEFEFGPVARGSYIALICMTPIVAILSPAYFFYYLLLLLFLGFGLPFFLLKSGLFNLWHSIGGTLQARWDRKYLDKRASDIERQIELEKYKKSRVRDPRLPKNW